jgi:outer membrane receptor for ferrienterochelin and colicins
MARPSINASYPTGKPNPELSPDRIGNPDLKPELATGLDLALEKYLPNGGLISVGVFHRRIAGLIRNAVTQTAVPWATVARWVSRPINLESARSTGVELELKGRAGELLPAIADPAMALSLRASLSLYRSSVDGLPGPDNRLESQQPWSLNLGFDHVLKGMPLTYGVSFAFMPAYSVQQTSVQLVGQAQARTLDAYALWAFDKQASLRLAVSNAWPLDSVSRTLIAVAGGDAQTSVERRSNLANFSAGMNFKF